MSNEVLILIGVVSVIALLTLMIKGKVHPFIALGLVSIAVFAFCWHSDGESYSNVN